VPAVARDVAPPPSHRRVAIATTWCRVPIDGFVLMRSHSAERYNNNWVNGVLLIGYSWDESSIMRLPDRFLHVQMYSLPRNGHCTPS